MRIPHLGLAASLIFALIAGYAGAWGLPYLRMLQGSDSSSVMMAASVTVGCGEVGILSKECLMAYQFPVVPLSQKLSELNFGIIVPSYRISCDGTGRLVSSSKGLIGNRNSVSAVRLSELYCAKTIDVSIWSGGYYNLSGIVSGRPFYSSLRVSRAYADLVQFFFGQLRLILLLFFIFSISIAIISSRLELPELCTAFPNVFLVPWALFLLTSSGVLAILTGGVIPTDIYVHANSLLSTVCHLGPAVYVLIGLAVSKKKAIYFSVGICALLPLVTDGWLQVYPLLGMGISIVALAVSIKALDWLACLYYVVLFVNYLKLAGGLFLPADLLPHIHISSVFLGTAYLVSSLRRVRVIIRVYHLNRITSEQVRDQSPEDYLRKILTTISGALGGISQKLFIFSPGHATVQLFEGSEEGFVVREVSSEKVPAHVIRAINLSSSGASSELFLSESGQAVGFVIKEPGSFTAVQRFCIDSDHAGEGGVADLQLCMDEIRTSFHRALLRYNSLKDLSSSEAKQQIIDLIRSAHDLQSLLSVANAYLGSKNLRGFMGEEDTSIKRVTVFECFGYTSETSNFLKRLTFNSEDNGSTNAPIPLALSQNRSVSIDDVELILPFLSEYSREVLVRAGTKSLLVIPARVLDGGVSRTMMLFVDSCESAAFDAGTSLHLEFFFELVAGELLKLLRIRSADSALATLAKTVPSHVLDKLREGKSVREEACGFLICADIIGSTGLFRSLGDSEWSVLVDSISAEIKTISTDFENAELDVVVWDAFFVTIPTADSGVALALSQAIYHVISRRLSDIAMPLQVKCGVRVCVCYGDISRDFSSGINSTWTIVGGAMARVCKFESSVKILGSGIYFDSSASEYMKPIAHLFHQKENSYVLTAFYEGDGRIGYPVRVA